jgi:hypothetical protein
MANYTLAQNLTRLNKAREDIADAIVARGGSATHTDGLESMPTNIQAIPNQYAQADEGKVVSNGALVSQTSTNATTNGTIDTTTNNEVVVAVPNTYAAGDEGKVVSNGALVAQGSDSVTENGTVDTTLISSLLVDVDTSSIAQLTSLTSDVGCDLYFVNNNSGDTSYIFGMLWSNSGSTLPTTMVFSYPSTFIPAETSVYVMNAYFVAPLDVISSVTVSTVNRTVTIGYKSNISQYRAGTAILIRFFIPS